MSGTHVSDHVYLVVSPNPVWGNRTEAYKYEDKKGNVHVLDKPQTLHFVKIGDEVNFGARVSEYNTHNPQMWYHYIAFKDYKKEKDKQPGLGTKIETLFSENNFENSRASNEWFLVWNAGRQLQSLCEGIAKMEVKDRKSDKDKNITFDVVEFDDEDALIKEIKNSGITKPEKTRPESSKIENREKRNPRGTSQKDDHKEEERSKERGEGSLTKDKRSRSPSRGKSGNIRNSSRENKGNSGQSGNSSRRGSASGEDNSPRDPRSGNNNNQRGRGRRGRG